MFSCIFCLRLSAMVMIWSNSCSKLLMLTDIVRVIHARSRRYSYKHRKMEIYNSEKCSRTVLQEMQFNFNMYIKRRIYSVLKSICYCFDLLIFSLRLFNQKRCHKSDIHSCSCSHYNAIRKKRLLLFRFSYRFSFNCQIQ